MEPTDADGGVVIVAAFCAGDVRRLHALLCAYESPFVTDAEAKDRSRNVLAYGSRVRSLLTESCQIEP